MICKTDDSIRPKHYFDSKVAIKTTVRKQAEWRRKLWAARSVQ